MEAREIKFNAFVCFGDNEEIKAMIKDVTIYKHGDMGCSLDSFNEAIKHSGYAFDGEDYFFPFDEAKEWIDAKEFNITTGDDWVFFSGIPLQSMERKDMNDKTIYEGDVLIHQKSNPVKIVCKFHSNKYGSGLKLYELDGKEYRNSIGLFYEIIGNIHEHPELLK